MPKHSFSPKTPADFAKEMGYRKIKTGKLLMRVHKQFVSEFIENYDTKSLVYPTIFSVRPDAGRVKANKKRDDYKYYFEGFDHDKAIEKLEEAKKTRSVTKGRSRVKEIEKMWKERGE